MFKKKAPDYRIILRQPTTISVGETKGFKAGHTILMAGCLYTVVRVKDECTLEIVPKRTPTWRDRLVAWVKGLF